MKNYVHDNEEDCDQAIKTFNTEKGITMVLAAPFQFAGKELTIVQAKQLVSNLNELIEYSTMRRKQ